MNSCSSLLFRIRSWLLSIGIGMFYIQKELFLRKCLRHRSQDFKMQDGKIAIITGGSRGIGFEIVKAMLNHGCNVIIGSSSSEEKRASIEKTLREEFPGTSVEVWHLDLASLKSVKNFAERFLSSGRPLHFLINNGGILSETYEITEDDCERHFAVNYLSHCLLTILLLPQLESSGTEDRKSRIVNTSSVAHRGGIIKMSDLQSRTCYSKYHAYMQSKLAQVMFTYDLQSTLDKKNSTVTINSVHPGIVNTDILSYKRMKCVIRHLLKTPAEGAETTIYAALSDEMEGVGGKYLEECKVTKSSRISYDQSIQSELWKETWRLMQPWLNSRSNECSYALK